jgi:WD40 repeat protein
LTISLFLLRSRQAAGRGEPKHPSELVRIQHDPQERKWDWHRQIDAIAFSPDARLLATGSRDQTARLWEIPSGREIERVDHDGSVKLVAFSVDGSQLITATGYTVRIDDLAGHFELGRISAPGYFRTAEQSPDGTWIAVAGGSAMIVSPMTAHADVARLHYAVVPRFFPPTGAAVTVLPLIGTVRG